MTFPSKVISPLATLGPLARSKVTKGPKGKFDKLLMCGSLPLRRTAGLAGQEMQEIKFHYGRAIPNDSGRAGRG